ncbi:MAG TPA: ABC transporter ATP-binding protein [Anaerolineae bacterium]|nr:ABC transporter ATP-binding protein [Anaerolineae bacterium]
MMAVRAERGEGGDSQVEGGTLRRSLSYLTRYPRLTTTAVLGLLLATAAQLAVPQIIQNIIDVITNNMTVDQIDLAAADQALITAMVMIVVFAVARGIFAFIQTYTSQALSHNIAFELRNDIFSQIQRLSFSYHDQNQTGQLMVRATDDVERLRGFIGQGALQALQALILLVGTLSLLFFTNLKLTLYILPILPITMVVFGLFGVKAQPLFRGVQMKLSTANTILQENLAGIKVVKAFASEARERARFRQSIDDLLEQRLVVSRTLSFLFPTIFLVANMGQAAVLYFGGREIIGGTLTVGEWQKFSIYLVYLFFPMGQLGFIIGMMAQAGASAERIFEIMDAKNDVEDKPDAVELVDVKGNVVFEGVTFRYFVSGEAVLQNINFEAEAGQTIALLGTTGSGKTTIINLIPRFYDVSEGRVLIDGHDVRDVTLDSLRKRIGIVLQETTLFGGTIRDNIAFGRPEATMAEVEAAARAAAAHDFIVSFPDGYETAVGERGTTLSGGQKQRIAIARALLLNPQILILDDSTSSVDLNTEYEIQQALDTLMAGRTSFVIAQRISTVVNADLILVLDQGQIVAQGTHETLLENEPIYAEIYHSQLDDDMVAA